jgi:hypothetical protein
MRGRTIHLGSVSVLVCLLTAALVPAADVDILWPDQPLPVIDGAIDPVWSLATKQLMTICTVYFHFRSLTLRGANKLCRL